MRVSCWPWGGGREQGLGQENERVQQATRSWCVGRGATSGSRHVGAGASFLCQEPRRGTAVRCSMAAAASAAEAYAHIAARDTAPRACGTPPHLRRVWVVYLGVQYRVVGAGLAAARRVASEAGLCAGREGRGCRRHEAAKLLAVTQGGARPECAPMLYPICSGLILLQLSGGSLWSC